MTPSGQLEAALAIKAPFEVYTALLRLLGADEYFASRARLYLIEAEYVNPWRGEDNSEQIYRDAISIAMSDEAVE